MSLDLLQWIFMAFLGAGGLWLAFKKSGGERSSLNGNAAQAYANAAKLKADENIRLEEEIVKLNNRLELVERKKYRVVIEFTIGDPPELGKVAIEPIVDIVTPKIRPRHKRTGV